MTFRKCFQMRKKLHPFWNLQDTAFETLVNITITQGEDMKQGFIRLLLPGLSKQMQSRKTKRCRDS